MRVHRVRKDEDFMCCVVMAVYMVMVDHGWSTFVYPFDWERGEAATALTVHTTQMRALG